MRRNQVVLLKRLAKFVPKRYRARLGMLYFHALSVFYMGDRVICPCCGGHFRSFVGASSSNGKGNRMCPRCLSLERHRVLSLYLRERTNIFTDKLKVLHFAPELCFYNTFKNASNLEYITADIDSPLADVQINIMDINFEDKTFDVILCSHVLEHISDDRKAMSELYRILKAGGWAIIQSPVNIHLEKTIEDSGVTTPEERLRNYGHSDHRRSYGRDYVQKLEAVGFAARPDTFALELDDAVVERYGLRRDEVVYFVTKPAPIV